MGLLPPPLWGRAGEGGGAVTHDFSLTEGPPPPTPPHKGEESAPSSSHEGRLSSISIQPYHDSRNHLSYHPCGAGVRRGVDGRPAGRGRHHLAGTAHRH